MAFSEELKLKVKKRSHFSCCLCHTLGVEIHHIIPQADGGPDTEENAAPLCPTCHELYGANPEKRKFIRETRDFWYELCDNRFAGDTQFMREIKKRLDELPSKSDLLDALEKILSGINFDTERMEKNSPEKHEKLLSDFAKLEVAFKQTKHTLDIREIEVRAILAQAYELANTDSLTHLPNRRKVLALLQEETIRATRYSTPLSIILIELDQYNYIREAHGRFDADILLREFTDNKKGLIQHPNTIGRLDGGEFLIVLPASDISVAIKLVKNLFERDRSKPIASGGASINATVSAGVVQFLHGQENWEEMLMRADKTLRIAKKNGRDQWIALEE